MDAAAEPTDRELSGGHQSVGRSPADSQQLRGPWHREQKGQIVEHARRDLSARAGRVSRVYRPGEAAPANGEATNAQWTANLSPDG